jgi:predicted phosphodiesterase
MSKRKRKHTITSLRNDEVVMDQIRSLAKSGMGRRAIANQLGLNLAEVTILVDEVYRPHVNTASLATIEEFQIQSEKQERRAQRFQDLNRVERKTFREGARWVNAIEALLAEINDTLATYKFSTPKRSKSSKKKKTSPPAIVQLSDCHLNEVVDLCDTLNHNEYSYEVACQRLKKYADTARHTLKAFGVEDVLVANTGDMLNSDRRLDELLTNAGNRSKAIVVAVDIIQQFIRDLAKDFNVSYLTVCGNESRKDQEIGSTSRVFSHNYDYDLHMLLAQLFRNTNVNFIDMADTHETMIRIGGHNVVFMHGHQLGSAPEKKIEKVVAKYSIAGHLVDYTIFGHMHSTLLGDNYGRGSSLVGSNAYSSNTLQVSGYAAQNMYVIKPEGIIPIPIPLQNVDGVKGYEYDQTFAAGSGMKKSVEKTKTGKVVFEIVI